MTTASYHNHSSWSDGATSIAEMVAGAAALGLGEVGLSDHVVLHPEGRRYRWSMPPEQLGAYVEEVRRVGAAAPLPVRLGVEVDWFPGHGAAIAAALAPYDFDYLIGSVHEVDGFSVDGSPEPWRRLGAAERNEIHRGYWRRMEELAGAGLVDVIAHLDLPKKFDVHPTVDLGREQAAALDAIAAADLVVELNTAGWHKPCRDAYPSEALLAECARRSIRVTLSADAHRPDHLVRDFDRGLARLRAAGFTGLARFEARRVRVEPIDEC